jgi:hypothetical protein
MTECYMCSSEAVSQEHVPPSCIFPELKDLPPGVDYRRNLITVPSCVIHNLKKSGDDEYLLFVLVTNWAVNDVGLSHWKKKILRSINHRPSKLGLYKNLRPVFIKGINTGVYDIDFDRISGEVEKISRGIYYHHFQKHWLCPIDVVLPAAVAIGTPESTNHNKIVRQTTAMITKFLESETVFGENPDVFYYQFKINEDLPAYVLRMVFYSGIEISSLSNLLETTQPKTT